MAKNQGWHGDSKGHSKAAKGIGKDERTSSGQGWHGDPKGHAKAAKGESKNSKSLKDKLFGE